MANSELGAVIDQETRIDVPASLAIHRAVERLPDPEFCEIMLGQALESSRGCAGTHRGVIRRPGHRRSDTDGDKGLGPGLVLLTHVSSRVGRRPVEALCGGARTIPGGSSSIKALRSKWAQRSRRPRTLLTHVATSDLPIPCLTAVDSPTGEAISRRRRLRTTSSSDPDIVRSLTGARLQLVPRGADQHTGGQGAAAASRTPLTVNAVV